MADRTIIGYGGAGATAFTPVTAANPLPVTSGAGTVTTGQNLSALNAYTQYTPGVNGTMLVQVTGTFVGTLSLLGQVDGVNYLTFGATPQFLNLNTGAYTATITATGIYQTSVNSLVGARISMTAYTSGTAVVSASITNAPAMIALDAAIPTGDNWFGRAKIGDGSNLVAVKASGVAPLTTDNSLVASLSPNSYASAASLVLGSTATTNATSVKTSAASLFHVGIYNTSASTVYVKLYEKASAPTVGSDTPFDVITVATGGRFSEEYGQMGRRVPSGLALAITGAAADSDTTAIATGVRVRLTYI